MDAISEILNRAIEQLLGRASGPMHVRLVIQPIVATILAIRAGLRDARERKPAFFWTILTSSQEREILLRSGWKDIGKLFVVAMVLDGLYQLVVFRGFYIVQALIVAVVIAVIPYALLRGVVTRLARAFQAGAPTAAEQQEGEKRQKVSASGADAPEV